MEQNLGINSLAVRRDNARLKLLHNIYYNKKFLSDSVTPKRPRCADTRFKPVTSRVQAYSNSFVPLTTQQQNTLPANIVNINCLVKFSEKLNESIKQCSYLRYLVIQLFYICVLIYLFVCVYMCICMCVYVMYVCNVCVQYIYVYVCEYDVCVCMHMYGTMHEGASI